MGRARERLYWIGQFAVAAPLTVVFALALVSALVSGNAVFAVFSGVAFLVFGAVLWLLVAVVARPRRERSAFARTAMRDHRPGRSIPGDLARLDEALRAADAARRAGPEQEPGARPGARPRR